MNTSKFDPMIAAMETALMTVKGEVYALAGGKKKAAAVARASLLDIQKVVKKFRSELQAVKNSMAVRRRNMTDEQKKQIVEKRKATMASRKRKVETPVA